MSSLLVLILFVLIGPSFIGHLLTTDNASILYFLRDKVAMILQAILILILVCNDKPFKKHIAVIMLVVSVWFLINFYVVDGEEKSGYFNYVIEKGNE